MPKPVFDVLLTPREGHVLSSVHRAGVPATTRIICDGIADCKETFDTQKTYAVLKTLVEYTLVTREDSTTETPTGPEPRVLWELSDEGKKFFP